MSDKIELLPCPFCGLAARLESNRDWHRIVVDHDEQCVFLEPEAVMVPATDDQLSVAVADWNRRAALAPQPAPAAPVAHEPHTFWVLFDATAEQRFIKKMLPEGFLAFFDCERDARLAKARNPGTDYKRIDYYTAPPAAEQPDHHEDALNMVHCACGDAHPASSFDAGFIRGSGMCQNCDAAIPAKDVATMDEQLRKDAERYRWLKACNGGPIGIIAYAIEPEMEIDLVEDRADAAIDAAMEAGQ